MAITFYGDGSKVSGIPAGGVTGQAIGPSSYTGTDLPRAYDYSFKQTLYTGITDSGTQNTRTYNFNGVYSFPAQTIALILRIRYNHAGSTNHGYFSFKAYQQGNNSNYATYDSSHYDWYYNTTNEYLFVPWDTASFTDKLLIECTASYNSSSSNTYNIYLDGIIKGY